MAPPGSWIRRAGLESLGGGAGERAKRDRGGEGERESAKFHYTIWTVRATLI